MGNKKALSGLLRASELSWRLSGDSYTATRCRPEKGRIIIATGIMARKFIERDRTKIIGQGFVQSPRPDVRKPGGRNLHFLFASACCCPPTDHCHTLLSPGQWNIFVRPPLILPSLNRLNCAGA